jgi:hypothetical protein
MIWIGKALQAVPLLYRLIGYVVVAVALWGSFELWKHSIYRDGYRNGERNVQEQWSASIEQEQKDGEKARSNAERLVRDEPPDSVRDDPWNRDLWQK